MQSALDALVGYNQKLLKTGLFTDKEEATITRIVGDLISTWDKTLSAQITRETKSLNSKMNDIKANVIGIKANVTGIKTNVGQFDAKFTPLISHIEETRTLVQKMMKEQENSNRRIIDAIIQFQEEHNQGTLDKKDLDDLLTQLKAEFKTTTKKEKSYWRQFSDSLQEQDNHFAGVTKKPTPNSLDTELREFALNEENGGAFNPYNQRGL